MASRKEQKEALRREREERERQAQDARRRKRLVGYGIGGALALAALVVLVLLLVSGGGGGGGGDDATAEVLPDGGEVPRQQVTDLAEAAKAGDCTLKSERGQGAEHTEDPAETVRYSTNPPTTGKHYIEPATDGAFGEAPRDEALVHGLEHGRVIIWFKPSLPEDARANLRALFDQDSYQMFLVPRTRMEPQVAASAWNRDPEPRGTGRLLLCPRFNERSFDALRTFRDEHRSNGPEPVP